MPKIARELSALAVQRLKEPGMHFVGGVPGLALHITLSGARSWLLRAMIAGKRREMGLGAYPLVTLAAAREKAREARAAIGAGVDPVAQKAAAQSAMKAERAAAKNFKTVAGEYITTHEAGWRNAKHAQQWRNTLEQYAYPVIGPMLVRDVEKEHVLSILKPIWTEKTETASRVRQRIEQVLSYAMQAGYRPEALNPARLRGNLDKLLTARKQLDKVKPKKHHHALPIDDMSGFVQRLRKAEGNGARALEFVILTAARSGEVRGATWAEIDLDKAMWTIPAGRMKAGKEHRVPLSRAAVNLLRALPRDDGDPGAYVFPAPRGGQLSDMTLAAVIRRFNDEGDKPRWIDPKTGQGAVPHGFRSTFRDWAAERTHCPHEVAEMALAHTVGDKVEAAYRRGDLFPKRRELMDLWARFIDTEPAKGNVRALRGAKATA